MLLIGLFYDIFLDCHVLIQHRFTADVVFHPRKDDRKADSILKFFSLYDHIKLNFTIRSYNSDCSKILMPFWSV